MLSFYREPKTEIIAECNLPHTRRSSSYSCSSCIFGVYSVDQRLAFAVISARGPAKGKRSRGSGLSPSLFFQVLSAAAEVLVEVHDLGALLKAEDDIEVGALATIERDGFLDVVGDAGAFLGALKSDAGREWSLAENRLIRCGDGDEILEIHNV